MRLSIDDFVVETIRRGGEHRPDVEDFGYFGTNAKLADGLGHSKEWKELDVDESYVDFETTWRKYEAIEAVVYAAWAGQEKNPLATLWHFAARCNQAWPISQFLKDPIACKSLMAEDSYGNTALDIAIVFGHFDIAAMLLTYININGLQPDPPRAISYPSPKRTISDVVSAESALPKAKKTHLAPAQVPTKSSLPKPKKPYLAPARTNVFLGSSQGNFYAPRLCFFAPIVEVQAGQAPKLVGYSPVGYR